MTETFSVYLRFYAAVPAPDPKPHGLRPDRCAVTADMRAQSERPIPRI